MTRHVRDSNFWHLPVGTPLGGGRKKKTARGIFATSQGGGPGKGDRDKGRRDQTRPGTGGGGQGRPGGGNRDQRGRPGQGGGTGPSGPPRTG